MPGLATLAHKLSHSSELWHHGGHRTGPLPGSCCCGCVRDLEGSYQVLAAGAGCSQGLSRALGWSLRGACRASLLPLLHKQVAVIKRLCTGQSLSSESSLAVQLASETLNPEHRLMMHSSQHTSQSCSRVRTCTTTVCLSVPESGEAHAAAGVHDGVVRGISGSALPGEKRLLHLHQQQAQPCSQQLHTLVASRAVSRMWVRDAAQGSCGKL